MQSSEIRKKFFDFFKKRGHTVVPSSSLIPAQDPTLLFTNAGMNQFKDIFLGKEKRSYDKAVSIQKCMRAGGKHNDLDNVGYTNRHLTFFEMMGNFSFGDYFKKDAIQYAWDFLTKEMGFDPNNIYVAVYKDDDESYQVWQYVIGLPEDRIYRLGPEHNFWQMGDTGPCGPCTEIYVDRGEEYGCGKKSCGPGCECDRYLEVWNLVFMQYDRQDDGSDQPLKQKGVDTGMGLERLCMIVQDKKSVFNTDLFEPVIKKIEELTGLNYKKQSKDIQAAFHVLADHIRATCFLIADGCTPSNEGRGYVLRKIIRRAALFGKKLGDGSLFPQLAQVFIEQMSPIYPELKVQKNAIIKLIKNEVDRFATNLVQGEAIVEKYINQAKDKMITGQQAFKLYDTFGFPLELTRVIAHERGFDVDIEGFEKHMEQQRAQSGKKKLKKKAELPENIHTEFIGYKELEASSKIIALIVKDKLVSKVNKNETCWVIPERTPFFVEKGGQVSDHGFVIIDEHKVSIEGLKFIGDAIAVKLKAPVELNVGGTINQIVDKEFRLNTMKNHTATHLLQAALIELLGKQVRQAGSLVHPDYLRFDFTYNENLTPEQVKWVEDRVNEKIMENIPVNIECTTHKEAIDKGVIAIFGEKYNPEEVRIIDIPGFSAELCGGTHVYSTGDIGAFKITDQGTLSAGQRRIWAVTGPKAIELLQDSFNMVKKLSQEFKVQSHEVVGVVQKQKEAMKELHQQLKKLRKERWKAYVPVWLEKVSMVGKVPFLYLQLEGYGNEELKEIVYELLNKKPGFYFLISGDGKATFFVQLAPTLSSIVDMKAFATWLKEQGFRGGGKELTLQGGGPSIDPSLEKKIQSWLKSQ